MKTERHDIDIKLDPREWRRLRHLARACDMDPKALAQQVLTNLVNNWARHGNLAEMREADPALGITHEQIQDAADRVRATLPSQADATAALMTPWRERT